MKKVKKLPNYVCCVGFHVHHATFAISILCFTVSCTFIVIDMLSFNNNQIRVGSLFSYVYFVLWQRVYYHVAVDVVLNFLWAISSVLLLYGNVRLNVALYWPFIGVTHLNVIIHALKVPLFVWSGISVIRNEIEEVPAGGRVATCIQIILLICLNCILLLLNWYSVGVVMRSRCFLLKHGQTITEATKMEMRKCILHLDGYHPSASQV